MSEQGDDQPDRPRPRYGELAPEGWNWTPPEKGGIPDAAGPHEGEARSRERRPTRRWDRPVTYLLLVAGIVGMFLNITVLQAAPESLQTLHSQNGLDVYTPAAAATTLITLGTVVQVVLYLVTAALSFVRMARKKPTFLVPLLAGVLAAGINLVAMTLVIATDSPILQLYNVGDAG